MNDEKSNYLRESIQKKALVGLTRLNWTPFRANGWLIGDWAYAYADPVNSYGNLMVINWILKMIIFGSGLFTNDIVNLKHQGACQKLMIG